MYNIDFNDTKALWEFAKETCKLAETYLKTREEYATNLKNLKLELAKSYANDTIKESISEEKAYLKLASTNEELKKSLELIIEKEQLYKGLEKVLEARHTLIYFNQAIIKNQPSL